MNTVNSGAELFTVSVNDTATNFSATSPSTTVENLKPDREREMFYLTTHSTHFIQRNHPSTNVDYLKPEREREMFYLTTHSTHFIQRNHPSTTVENLKPDREREGNVLFNNALNTFYSAQPSQHHRGESETRQREREMFYLTTHSTHFIQRHQSQHQRGESETREREGNVLFNDALNTFYSAPPVPAPPWRIWNQRKREMFYLTTHSTHFIQMNQSQHHRGESETREREKCFI